ncbi:MAG: phosphatidylinositol-specific phospholipase C/glycerophosphodiester phosphodiesterase family protein [Phycisphaerales bacterium]
MVRMTCVVGVLLALGAAPQGEVAPVPRAHAHNDYRHDPPLLKALGQGFTSVEADIFLVDDKLCVAHDAREIRPERTLQALYLDPLRQRVKRNGGRVYREGPRFTFLIDIKTAAEPTYRRLHEVLEECRDMLATFGPDGRKEGAILVIVSGNRPLEFMQSQEVRYAGCDGRLTDLDSRIRAEVMPLISDHWGQNFTWRGDGPMPPEERKKLDEIVQKAHAKGRLVRFWATPDVQSPARDAVWRELLSAGVDLINTDDLEGLRRFLLEQGR